jgi:hypothetical protein
MLHRWNTGIWSHSIGIVISDITVVSGRGVSRQTFDAYRLVIKVGFQYSGYGKMRELNTSPPE